MRAEAKDALDHCHKMEMHLVAPVAAVQLLTAELRTPIRTIGDQKAQGLTVMAMTGDFAFGNAFARLAERASPGEWCAPPSWQGKIGGAQSGRDLRPPYSARVTAALMAFNEDAPPACADGASPSGRAGLNRRYPDQPLRFHTMAPLPRARSPLMGQRRNRGRSAGSKRPGAASERGALERLQ